MQSLFIYILMVVAMLSGCATGGPVETRAVKTNAQRSSVQADTVDKASAPAPPPTKSPEPSPSLVSSSFNGIYLDRAGKPAGKGDPGRPVSEAIRIGMGSHPQALQDARLPKDKYGLIDWAKLIKENIITPRENLESPDEEPPLEMDVLIEAKSGFVNDVVFPHGIHTYWVKCDVCHDKIFKPARGENKMSMAGIAGGQWCGRCHSKVAFPLTDCGRCHVKVKEKKVG